MPDARTWSRTLVVILGLAWSLTLGLGGAWLIGAGHAAFGRTHAGLTPVAGLTGVVAGQLVFLVCVGDRLVPGVSRRVTLWTEVVLCMVLFAGVGATAVALWA